MQELKKIYINPSAYICAVIFASIVLISSIITNFVFVPASALPMGYHIVAVLVSFVGGALLGFVGGAILAAVYNITAKHLGGLRFHVSEYEKPISRKASHLPARHPHRKLRRHKKK